MLKLLCGQNWKTNSARDIYEDISAEDPMQQYSAAAHFPFFGPRILKVQNYVMNHNPHGWRQLWADRRNVEKWWTFWVCWGFFRYHVLVYIDRALV
jgi:hypothetical protein